MSIEGRNARIERAHYMDKWVFGPLTCFYVFTSWLFPMSKVMSHGFWVPVLPLVSCAVLFIYIILFLRGALVIPFEELGSP